MKRIAILSFCVLPFFVVGQLRTQIFVENQSFASRAFQDTLLLKNYVESQVLSWINDGHVYAGIDSIVHENGSSRIYLHKGSNVPIQVDGLKSKNILHQVERLLDSYADNGYPFAQIRIDSFQLTSGNLAGQLKIEPGPEIRYDTVFFIRQPATSKYYITKLLHVEPGKLFSEQDYYAIEDRIKRSSFLSLNRPPDVSISTNSATVFLDVEESTSSSFQGIVGLQQNPSGGSSLVGSLDLSIQNLFKSGHEFDFFWERFGEQSQQLDLYYKHALLLGADISPSLRFGLVKQDTSFLNRTTAIGITTFISELALLLEYENVNAALITSGVETVQFSNLADFQRNFYRIQLSQGFMEQFREFNEGFAWNLSLGIGSKEIDRNVSLPASYYDTLTLSSDFLRLDGRFAYQLKAGKRQAFFHDIQTGILENKEIQTNELYRVGGLASLRGFDEKNFFASQFLLSRLEFRSFFENSSYIFAFYDQLLFERAKKMSYPFGIGIGLALETSSSQFSFAFASGQSENQSISFSELRVHFGLITKF